MNDEEFFAKLLATFRIEAEEHLKALSDGLIALEKDLPQDQRKQTIEHIFREAHSLKGASRAVNQHAVEKICQALESVLAIWKQNQLQPSPQLFDTLYKTVDAIGSAMTQSPSQEELDKIIQRLEEVKEKSFNQVEEIKNKQPDQTTPPSKEPPQPKNSEPEKKDKVKQEEQAPVPESVAEPESSEKSTSKEAFKQKYIRVSLQKLNQLFQEAEEMLMVKLISQQQLVDLKRLYAEQLIQEKELALLLSDVQILRQTSHSENSAYGCQEAVKKIISFLDQKQKEIKFFREDLHKLIRNSEQNTHFVESIVDVLLEDMKKILMQPMSTLFEVMPRMVRNIARELGKEIQVDFQGGEIEVDRRVLEEIKDPVIHLIRNAIDHGIESPNERAKSNKPPVGTIQVIATESHGNHVALSIIDDGKGINFDKLKEMAIKQGLLSKKEATDLTEEETIKLAFHSGLSTSPIVTELSGRGLGLGIVSENVDRLGGQVIVESKLNQGTKFTLILPLTLATFRGIHITVAKQDFIMPTHNVRRVIRVKKEEIQTVANYETIIVDNRSIPYIHLADLLGIAKKDQKEGKESHYSFVLLISATEKTIAFGVDDVLHEQEVLVKGLGKQCVRVKNVMASTVMEWGTVIPILNPIDLIRSSTKGKIMKPTSEQQEDTSIKKNILLVEDSITTRLLLKNILESEGYIVKIAVDGLEALELLQVDAPDLILTDVEMPRMDGFTLIEKVREMENLKELPVIICTSRGSVEDRERGIELGANAYLDKSRFTQEELMSVLKKLL